MTRFMRTAVLEATLRAELTPAVMSGKAWLDENYPGWHAKVDIGVLDIGCRECCMIGQLETEGNYNETVRRLKLRDTTMESLGLFVKGPETELRSFTYDILTDLWIEMIVLAGAANDTGERQLLAA